MSYSYSPVAAFSLEDTSDDRLTGYAAPSGRNPTLLKLTANDTPISFARGAGYSTAAAAAGLRLGWCGFEVHGLRQAVAIGDDVKLICGVSGEVLATLPISLLDKTPPAAARLSAEDLVSMVRAPECCSDLEPLMPFAMNHYRRHGARQFIEASYQAVFGRWPDTETPDMDFTYETDEECVEYYLLDMMSSEEFSLKWEGLIPGPFLSTFRFDLTGLLS